METAVLPVQDGWKRGRWSAELANTTQETTIRILSHLSRQRIIRSSRGNTTILSPEKLSALLDRS